MKGFVFALLLLPATVSAEELPTGVELCSLLSEFAEGAMAGRQTGKPLREWLTLLDETKPKRPVFLNDRMQSIILDAYKAETHQDPALRVVAMREFSDSVMIGCLESLEDSSPGSP